MSDRKTPDSPFSLWHGLAANWHSRVARHVIDTTRATVQEGLALQRELTQARTLTDVAAVQGAAAQRMMDAIVEQTNVLSNLGVSMGKEFAASMNPAPEPTAPPPAE